MPVSETPVTGIILSVWSNEVPKVGMQPIRKKQLIEADLIDGFWLRHSLGGASDGDFSEAVVNVKYVVRDIIHQYSIQSERTAKVSKVH